MTVCRGAAELLVYFKTHPGDVHYISKVSEAFVQCAAADRDPAWGCHTGKLMNTQLAESDLGCQKRNN